jgi:hypothetical protein
LFGEITLPLTVLFGPLQLIYNICVVLLLSDKGRQFHLSGVDVQVRDVKVWNVHPTNYK